jgi:hypothetical protein
MDQRKQHYQRYEVMPKRRFDEAVCDPGDDRNHRLELWGAIDPCPREFN